MMNNKMPLIIISIVIAIIFYGYLDANNNKEQLLKNFKFTVARITSDWHYKNDNGIGVDYEYFVNKNRYSSTVNVDVKKNETYLLVYDSIKPRNCLVLEMYPIYDSIEPPKNGWKYEDLPIKVDTLRIKEHINKYK